MGARIEVWGALGLHYACDAWGAKLFGARSAFFKWGGGERRGEMVLAKF